MSRITYTCISTAIAAFTLTVFLSACSRSEEPRFEQVEQQQERELQPETSITFLDANGKEVSTVEAVVADNNKTRSQGLMNVENLPEDEGMLFIFEENKPRSFWMANTPLSLDIIFVNEDYEIVRIQRNTTPYSQEGIPSEAPAKYVVEVNSGYSVRHDIYEGGKIRIKK